MAGVSSIRSVSFVVRLVVKFLSSRTYQVRVCLVVSVENNCLCIYSVVGRQHFSNRESIRMTAADVCRTDSNISTTCFKRSGRRGEFVLTVHHLFWDTV
jgi:hypothetical protein